MGVLLTALATAANFHATLTDLTITLLEATGNNVLDNYDDLIAVLTAHTTRVVTFNLLKVDGTTACSASNSVDGGSNYNTSWATTNSGGTTCD